MEAFLLVGEVLRRLQLAELVTDAWIDPRPQQVTLHLLCQSPSQQEAAVRLIQKFRTKALGLGIHQITLAISRSVALEIPLTTPILL